MQVAGRRAFAGQPFRLGRQRAHDAAFGRAVDRAAEQGERGAQAAQRDPRLVDADRPAAGQHDRAIFQQVGMAFRHDLPQSPIGRGVGGERSAMQGEPSGQRLPGNRNRATI